MRQSDRGLFEAIGPNELTAYLRAHGWLLQREIGRRGSLWEHKPSSIEAVVPSDSDLSDYPLRVEEALNALVQVEKRSITSVINDVKATLSDVLRFKAPAADAGTLPFDKAVTFIEECRAILLASACSAWDPRPFYGPKKPHLASEYLNAVHMGQTERGSFVLTALSPVTHSYQGSLFEEELGEPFERTAVKRLMSGLAEVGPAIRSALNTGVYDRFQSAVAKGVSANFCDALATMVECAPREQVEISVTWASNLEAPHAEPMRFARASVDILHTAADVLREIEPAPDYELQGFVFKLARGEGAAEGLVTVVGDIDGITRRVQMYLPARQYNVAVRAHENENYIVCTGDLKKSGRHWTMENVRSFRTLR